MDVHLEGSMLEWDETTQHYVEDEGHKEGACSPCMHWTFLIALSSHCLGGESTANL